MSCPRSSSETRNSRPDVIPHHKTTNLLTAFNHHPVHRRNRYYYQLLHIKAFFLPSPSTPFLSAVTPFDKRRTQLFLRTAARKSSSRSRRADPFRVSLRFSPSLPHPSQEHHTREIEKISRTSMNPSPPPLLEGPLGRSDDSACGF